VRWLPFIRWIRERRVILDLDLALLYRVQTRALVQAVKRNGDRFPEDFCFQLTPAEAAALRSQIVISKVGRGGRRYAPYAFTEHGALSFGQRLSYTLGPFSTSPLAVLILFLCLCLVLPFPVTCFSDLVSDFCFLFSAFYFSPNVTDRPRLSRMRHG
jgi:hypothetical protein